MSPQFAYDYVVKQNEKKLPIADGFEDMVMTDPFYAFRYAQIVLKTRSQKVENTILNSKIDSQNLSDIALWYSQEVIKGLWQEAESVIAVNPLNAYKYIRDCANENNIYQIGDDIHQACFSNKKSMVRNYISLLRNIKNDFDFNRIIHCV